MAGSGASNGPRQSNVNSNLKQNWSDTPNTKIDFTKNYIHIKLPEQRFVKLPNSNYFIITESLDKKKKYLIWSVAEAESSFVFSRFLCEGIHSQSVQTPFRQIRMEGIRFVEGRRARGSRDRDRVYSRQRG